MDRKREGNLFTSSTYENGSKVRTIPSICIFLNKHYRAEIVRWVSESKRPFKIVKDRGFQKLMKTGRPDYHIPSPETVSHNIKKVFLRVLKRMAKMLQVHQLLKLAQVVLLTCNNP
jgi:hypothetical protein